MRRPSSVIDVSGGYEAWFQDRRRAFRHSITAMGRKQRKLEREEGAVRFQFHTHDHQALDTPDALEVGPVPADGPVRPLRPAGHRAAGP